MKEHLKNDNLTKFGMPASGGFFNLVASISSRSFHGCLSCVADSLQPPVYQGFDLRCE